MLDDYYSDQRTEILTLKSTLKARRVCFETTTPVSSGQACSAWDSAALTAWMLLADVPLPSDPAKRRHSLAWRWCATSSQSRWRHPVEPDAGQQT